MYEKNLYSNRFWQNQFLFTEYYCSSPLESHIWHLKDLFFHTTVLFLLETELEVDESGPLTGEVGESGRKYRNEPVSTSQFR